MIKLSKTTQEYLSFVVWFGFLFLIGASVSLWHPFVTQCVAAFGVGWIFSDLRRWFMARYERIK